MPGPCSQIGLRIAGSPASSAHLCSLRSPRFKTRTSRAGMRSLRATAANNGLTAESAETGEFARRIAVSPAFSAHLCCSALSAVKNRDAPNWQRSSLPEPPVLGQFRPFSGTGDPWHLSGRVYRPGYALWPDHHLSPRLMTSTSAQSSAALVLFATISAQRIRRIRTT